MTDLTGRPSSGAPRVEPHDPAALDPERRALYDAITTGPRGAQKSVTPVADPTGRLLGPFDLMLYTPKLGDALQSVGTALRFHGMLTPRSRELAILAVAAAAGSEFEWWSHERAALAAGLAPAHLQQILDGAVPDDLDEHERMVVTVARALARERRLDDPDYLLAERILGRETLAELTWLVGYYEMLALALETFRPPNPMSPPH